MCDFILLSYFFTIMMKRNNKKVSTMVYKLVIPMLCICSTMSLYAEEKGLGDIIQQVAQDKALVKPSVKKKEVKKASRFVFKDEYHANGIGDIDKTKEKSETEKADEKISVCNLHCNDKKILIIEDNEQNFYMMRFLLEKNKRQI